MGRKTAGVALALAFLGLSGLVLIDPYGWREPDAAVSLAPESASSPNAPLPSDTADPPVNADTPAEAGDRPRAVASHNASGAGAVDPPRAEAAADLV
ncbi:MAG: hypothetical protein AAF913_06665, partial [Pseudomonadota bacterium]